MKLSYAEDIRDIKPPVEFPPDYFLWLVLLAALILAGIAFWFRVLIPRAKQPKKVFVPPKSPHQIALERLTALEQESLPYKGQFKEYYSQLSDIVRRYMEDRFYIRAPEMTTQEFLWSLNDAVELNDVHKKLLKDFLSSCDMVKFARYGPTIKETEESFQLALKLVNETSIR